MSNGESLPAKLGEVDRFLNIIFEVGIWLHDKYEKNFTPEQLPNIYSCYITSNITKYPETITFNKNEIAQVLDEIKMFRNSNHLVVGPAIRNTLLSLDELKTTLIDYPNLEYVLLEIKGSNVKESTFSKVASYFGEWIGAKQLVTLLTDKDGTVSICKDKKLTRKQIERLVEELEIVKVMK